MSAEFFPGAPANGAVPNGAAPAANAANAEQALPASVPASVRGAMDLGAQAQAPAAPAEQGAARTWRVDVETNEDFQKYVNESGRGAVIFALYAPHSPASLQMLEATERLVNSAEGSMLLAAVDIVKLPEAAQVFGVTGVPAGIAVLGGRPAPIYTGTISPEELTQVLGQVLQLAAQYQLPGGFEPINPEAEKPLPPLHAAAIAALDAGDYAGARESYRKAIAENPGDKDAKIGLAQVGLLERVSTMNAAEVRAAAANNPNDIQAAFNVADLDLTGGHVENAYTRLLRLFSTVDADSKAQVRERLVELFSIVGDDDPRTKAARGQLTMLLF